jgi:hypothetical protein
LVDTLKAGLTSVVDFFAKTGLLGKAGVVAERDLAFTASLTALDFIAGTGDAFAFTIGLFAGAFAEAVFLAGMFGL